jgi:hypothetical protein
MTQQYQQFEPPMAQPPRRKKRHLARNTLLGVAGLIVLIAIIANVSRGGSNKPSSSPSSPAAAAASAPSSAPASAPAAPQYTVAQQQAITAAEQYLSMGSGFSRAGLIQQLDSSAGSGFSESLALFAVNHVQVNWDQQAVEAAKGYMQMGGFSYSSLVQQLESSAGAGFTPAQARYGARSVGL